MKRVFVKRHAATAILLVFASSLAAAQGQSQPASAPGLQAPAEAYQKVNITAGRSTVLPTDFNITRIAVTDPEIADAVVVEPREILIDGKKAGTISLIVWGNATRKQYDIVVEQPVAPLEQQLRALFPGEDVTVSTSEGATVLSGRVSSTNVMLRMGEIAAASIPKAQLVNLLQVPGGSESQQVMLQVRFAEVNRRALNEAGIGLFLTRDRWLARTTTGQFATPDFEGETGSDRVVFSDFLNLFLWDRELGIGGVLRALEQSGGFQSLAEPNLIAYNGQEASFLAGGEFPVPVVSGGAGTVSVVFKEFGIRLTFTPTIAGDVIRLKVAPEVSTLDFANGITLEGFRIPGLTTRRAQTVVELRDGQSFAIAGLLDNESQNDAQAIPLLSKLPIIGPLFKSKAERADQTELMVLITPRLVRALDPDEVPPLPTTPDMFLKKPAPPKGSGGVGDSIEGGAGLLDAPLGASVRKPNGSR